MPEAKHPKVSKEPKEPATVPEPIPPRPSIHNLETHDLTVREQLMRQWPTWDWETRDET